MKILKYLFIFLILIKPSLALELKGDFKQGSLIIGKTNPKFAVYVQGKKVKINQKGFFIGLPTKPLGKNKVRKLAKIFEQSI